MTTQRVCRACGNSFTQYNHLITVCPNCASKKWTMKHSHLNKIGKVTKKWLDERRKWIKNNPADDTGHWYCYIPSCGKPLTIDDLELDHIDSRTRHPELRFVHANFAPICSTDNSAKGSLSLDEYLAKINA